MKHLLLLTVQPPPTQGVQGIRYAKLYEYLKAEGWQLHFVGPDPTVSAIQFLPKSEFQGERESYYVSSVGLERRASVMRQRSSGMLRGFWFFILAVAKLLVAIKIAKPYSVHLYQGMDKQIESALASRRFDAICGVTPGFWILCLAAKKAAEHSLPLISIYHDPHGYRNEGQFFPNDRSEQETILKQSVGVIFASNKTLKHYREAFTEISEKSESMTDSFVKKSEQNPHGTENIELLHLGNISEWRPIEPMLAALLKGWKNGVFKNLRVTQVGGLYPDAASLIEEDSTLNRYIQIVDEVPYLDSHSLAAKCSWLLVVVGPKHLDNLPSKMFEYLGHGKPILLIAPKGSEAGRLLVANNLGLTADCSCPEKIYQCLKQVSIMGQGSSSEWCFDDRTLAPFHAQHVAGEIADYFRSFLSSDNDHQLS